MQRRTLFLLTIVLSFCWRFNAYCSEKYVINKSENIQSQLKKDSVTYVIKYDFDLGGTEIIIPYGCKLNFHGGRLTNGTVKGNNTVISAKSERIFDNITLAGSWSNSKVYSEWLDFVEGKRIDNAKNFRNLMLLCVSDQITHLYMQKGKYYCSVISGSSNIRVPSNLYWHNSAIICQLPTKLTKYGFVLLQNTSNVTIEGGVFVGDVQTHNGKDGEWGHGIKVAGAKNVTLKNMTIREFWGDGIDLIEGSYRGDISAGVGPCHNITIDNVKCLYNRRQGLSIEAGFDITVKNSEFAHTGHYKMTDPGCGLDIEPWCKNEQKIHNIRIENCHIHDNNSKSDLCVLANALYNNQLNNNNQTPENAILVKNCIIGQLYINGANSVNFTDCVIDNIRYYNHGEKIKMVDCKIKKKSGFKTRWGVRTPRSLILTRCSE